MTSKANDAMNSAGKEDKRGFIVRSELTWLREKLIRNGFDAARLKENCLCVGSICREVLPAGMDVKGVFRASSLVRQERGRCSGRTDGRRKAFREKRSDCGRGWAHPTNGRSRRPFTRRTGSGQSVRMHSESGLPASRQAWCPRWRTVSMSTVRHG